MGVFPLLSFLLIVGIWERRKQIFIFLIINLLFLVLLNLYNYILTGTCMKSSLQSEQDIGTKKRNASVVVGCCGGEGWGESLRRFSKLNHYWVEPWLSLATGTADYKASKKWVPGCLTLIFLHWWCQRALQSHKQSQEWAEEGVAESCSHHPTATALPAWHRDWPWELRPEMSSAATKVLVVAAVWAAPVEGELVRAVAENSLLVLAFSGFFLCIW